MRVELYINGVRADLFDDESIFITDTIQDTRDPAFIFTAFSQTFTIPASKVNNKIFKYYYNNRIADGYDARFKSSALIKINGVDYKRGTIKLNSIIEKNNRPSSYTINFVADGADLKNVVENDDLSVLNDLNQYNHDYSLSLVRDGFEQGLGLSGGSMVRVTTQERSVIYPFISHTVRYVFDISKAGGASDPETYNVLDTTEGLLHTQLKPAVKLIRIIEAIEARYGLTFTRDFFGTTVFDDLYMWMNRTKGPIQGISENTSYFYELEYSSGDEWITLSGGDRPRITTFDNGNFGGKQTAELTYSTTITGGGNYVFQVYDSNDNNKLIFSDSVNTGNQSFVVDFESQNTKEWLPYVVIISEGSVTNIDFSVSAVKTLERFGSTTTETGTYIVDAQVPNDFVTMTANIPKMDVMDFLSSIFRMYNLTHFKNSDGEIYVDTLDNFYALGSSIDITKYVDVSEVPTEVPVPYDFISFKYSEPKTFLIKSREEELNDIFGDAEFSLGNLFNGSKYEIEVGFSHMLFEALPDLDSGGSSVQFFGWGVDDNENVFVDKPLIFVNAGTQTVARVDWDDGTRSTFYQKAANSTGITGGGESINFGTEIDEFSLNSNNDSLYKNYYENYIASIYGDRSRKVTYKAKLPASFIQTYSLNDTIVVKGVNHRINSITIDITTGESELELITQ